MPIYETFYNVAMSASALVSLGVIVLMWRHRQAPGARAMMVLFVALVIWTVAFLLESNATTLEKTLFFHCIGYIGLMAFPPLFLIFSFRYTNRDSLINWRNICLLNIIPLASLVIIWTNGSHHLIWADEQLITVGPFLVLTVTYKSVFWFLAVHNYLLVGVASILLIIRLFQGAVVYKKQVIVIMIALLLPLTWNIIYTYRLFNLPPKDLTPVMFSISGLVFVFGLMRLQLFKVIPFGYKLIVQEMSDGILIFDMSEKLLEANDNALKMTGFDSSIIGKSLADLHNMSSLFIGLTLVKHQYLELPLVKPDRTYHYELKTTPICDTREKQIGWCISIHDITLRKYHEQRLAEAYAKEQNLRRSLESEIQKRIQFTHALVHELKTPLTPIIASSELLTGALTEDPLLSIAQNIYRGGNNLNRKVDELLDLARSEMGTLKIKKDLVDYSDILTGAVNELESVLASRKQCLEVNIESTLPVVSADAARIRQVIFCLVDNALKFSREGDKVVLGVRHDNDRLVTEVRDNGPGLSTNEQSRLFQVYERSDNDRRRFSGLGLGLALSKSIVELHGGIIWVKSKKDAGSTFGFSLPA